jgi:hypothetical protein
MNELLNGVAIMCTQTVVPPQLKTYRYSLLTVPVRSNKWSYFVAVTLRRDVALQQQYHLDCGDDYLHGVALS